MTELDLCAIRLIPFTSTCSFIRTKEIVVDFGIISPCQTLVIAPEVDPRTTFTPGNLGWGRDDLILDVKIVLRGHLYTRVITNFSRQEFILCTL